LWIRFIDNEAALAAMVKGSSSVINGESDYRIHAC